jgi:hypothetical protein
MVLSIKSRLMTKFFSDLVEDEKKYLNSKKEDSHTNIPNYFS